jgi:hypothetical protein
MYKEDFKLRAYGFGELAQQYSPNINPKSANTKLHKWIKLNKKLSQELKTIGFSHKLRSLTPKMVELIIVALGEP